MSEIVTNSSRFIIVGDIHGCDRALGTLLDRIDLNPSDTLVILGDAIDRGPGSRQVLDHLCRVEQHCSLVYILGNHEEMLLDVLAGARPNSWLRHGGSATLDSYGGDPNRIPDEHLDLLGRTVPFWESSKVICVHANLEPGVSLIDQSPEWLRWQSLTGMEFPHPSGKLVVCGHTGQATGLPSMRDGWLCLDTLAYAGNFLTSYEAESMRFFQAAQSGQFREFHAKDLWA